MCSDLSASCNLLLAPRMCSLSRPVLFLPSHTFALPVQLCRHTPCAVFATLWLCLNSSSVDLVLCLCIHMTCAHEAFRWFLAQPSIRQAWLGSNPTLGHRGMSRLCVASCSHHSGTLSLPWRVWRVCVCVCALVSPLRCLLSFASFCM